MAVVDVLAVTDGFGLDLSTTAEVAAHYRLGVVELLRDEPGAHLSFARAVQLDPDFALGHAGVALTLARSGWIPDEALARAERAVGRANRRERQHVGILSVALRGDPVWAFAAARDHLREFAGDVVVANLVGAMATVTGDGELRAELRRLIGHLLARWEES